MAVTPPIDRQLTAEEFYVFEDAKGHELVEGWLVPRNATSTSSMMGVRVATLLGVAARHTLGECFGAGLGIRVDPAEPNTVRRASLCFVAKDRLPEEDTPFLDVVPDLVVEVASRLWTAEQLQTKVDYWLRFGVSVVWVVFPATCSVIALRRDSTERYDGEMEIPVDDVLPGVTVRASSFFEPA